VEGFVLWQWEATDGRRRVVENRTRGPVRGDMKRGTRCCCLMKGRREEIQWGWMKRKQARIGKFHAAGCEVGSEQLASAAISLLGGKVLLASEVNDDIMKVPCGWCLISTLSITQ